MADLANERGARADQAASCHASGPGLTANRLEPFLGLPDVEALAGAEVARPRPPARSQGAYRSEIRRTPARALSRSARGLSAMIIGPPLRMLSETEITDQPARKCGRATRAKSPFPACRAMPIDSCFAQFRRVICSP